MSSRASPQCSEMRSEVRLRRATTAGHPCPTGCRGWLTTTATRPGRGRPQSPRSTRRVPRRAMGTTGAPASRATLKAPARNGRRPSAEREGRLGEEQDGFTLRQGSRSFVRGVDAAFGVPPAHCEVPCPGEVRSDHRHVQSFSFGEEEEVAGQHRGEDDGVDVGGVVGRQDQGPRTWDVFEARRLHTAANGPQPEARDDTAQGESQGAGRNELQESPRRKAERREDGGGPRAIGQSAEGHENAPFDPSCGAAQGELGGVGRTQTRR